MIAGGIIVRKFRFTVRLIIWQLQIKKIVLILQYFYNYYLDAINCQKNLVRTCISFLSHP